MARRPDRRSADATEYRRLYKTAEWRSIRMHQLAEHPLCANCEKEGRVTAATVCDHVEPHRGDRVKFFAGPFQSLCDEEPWRCHSRAKQREETLGFSPAVGIDGFPVDPRHRANRARFDPDRG